jgi:hypothetical protein
MKELMGIMGSGKWFGKSWRIGKFWTRKNKVNYCENLLLVKG